MKKIIMVIVALAVLSSSLFGEFSSDTFPDTVSIGIENGTVFVYDRKLYSVNEQDVAKIQRILISGICGKKILRESIQSGRSAYFIYLYKDGTLSFSVTYCN